MTSITMSKSPRHFVRDLAPDATAPSSAMDVLRATAARVHKEILHLPTRPAPQATAVLLHATSRKER